VHDQLARAERRGGLAGADLGRARGRVEHGEAGDARLRRRRLAGPVERQRRSGRDAVEPRGDRGRSVEELRGLGGRRRGGGGRSFTSRENSISIQSARSLPQSGSTRRNAFEIERDGHLAVEERQPRARGARLFRPVASVSRSLPGTSVRFS